MSERIIKIPHDTKRVSREMRELWVNIRFSVRENIIKLEAPSKEHTLDIIERWAPHIDIHGNLNVRYDCREFSVCGYRLVLTISSKVRGKVVGFKIEVPFVLMEGEFCRAEARIAGFPESVGIVDFIDRRLFTLQLEEVESEE